MTDGLTVVNCKPLQPEGVDADPDQSLSTGRLSSNRSTDGLVGRITLRKVTSESTESSCIIASVSSWVSDPDSSCLRHEPVPMPLAPY